MLDNLTMPRDEDNFNTMPGGRPDPAGFVTEAPTSARDRRLNEGSYRTAEPDHAPARRSVTRLPSFAAP